MTEQYDAVIIGGGIAGSGLGTVLARSGKSVLILEKSTAFEDVVRGEWIAPWGVVEAKRTGLYDVLRGANDYHIPRHIEYGDGLDPAAGESRAVQLAMLPGIPGPLSVGHPQACQALFDAAVAAGATGVRGVTDVAVEPGAAPCVRYSAGGAAHEAAARLVVGADGRGSVVRRQAGIELHQEKTHHYFAGMLVDGADGWPIDTETMGTEGDVQFFVFPQAPGRLRLYLSFGLDQKSRFAGSDKERKFLEAFRLATVPNSESIANARIAGPCHAIPNHSTWTDTPVAPGVVLLGDAAGYNDPIIGQGLAITMRDIRVVSELLLGSGEWDQALFAPYVEERRERMRRLRMAAAMDSVVHAEFGPEATARKLRIITQAAGDPTLGMARAATMIGPEMLPPEVFSEEAIAKVVNA
jgi:2-polyprenyl-6-methoxyphenol hydroxylase-like FAD-dependent oxidoreductase